MATQEKSNTIKNLLNIIIRITVSVGLLSFLFYRCDLPKFYDTLKAVNLYMLIIAAGMLLICQLIASYRWSRILIVDGIDLPYRRVTSFYFLGMFFNLFLPTVIGGDVVKGYSFYRYTKKMREAITSILLDRLSGFCALMLLATVSIILGYKFIIEEKEVFYLLIIIISSFFFILFLITNKKFFTLQRNILLRFRLNKLEEKIDKLHQIIERYKSHRRMLSDVLLLSLIIQFTSIMIGYILSLALNLSVPIIYFFLFVPLITVFSMLPISIGGLGIREGMCVYLFNKIGVGLHAALSFSLLFYIITFIISLFGVIPLLTSKK